MQRELKFRVWSKKLNRYVMEDCDLCNWDHEFGDASISSYGTGIYDECIIEQYTGIKDKNAKEIYEGDIIDFRWTCNLGQKPSGGLTGVVDFDQGRFRIKQYATLGNYIDATLEIIGNVHENPELLIK